MFADSAFYAARILKHSIMRIKYIDVLKAFAIIAVVLYHTGLMTYGYLGVDLFLVISGYLTTKSLYAKMLDPENLTGGGQILFKV